MNLGTFGWTPAAKIGKLDATKLVGQIPYALLPVGTSAGSVAAGDDARMTNPRTPTAHAATHAAGGGSDPITIAESQVTNLTTDLAALAASIAAGPQKLDAVNSPTTINTTNAETTLYTKSLVANTLAAGRMVVWDAQCQVKNTSGVGSATGSFTIKCKFGGTTWFEDVTFSRAAAAAPNDKRTVIMRIRMWVTASNAQVMDIEYFESGATAPTTGAAGDIGGSGSPGGGSGSAAVDVASGTKDFVVTVTPSYSFVNFEFKLFAATLWMF